MKPIFLKAALGLLLLGYGFASGEGMEGPSGTGEGDRSPEHRWTESEVITSALRGSRKMASLATLSEIAAYRLRSSGWLQNPELRISDLSMQELSAPVEEYRVGLRFRLPRLGELAEERQEARVLLWERRTEEIRSRQEWVARVRKAYADVLLHDRLAELASRRVSIEAKRLLAVKEMMDYLGDRSIVYYTKARMWHAESKNDSARAVQNQKLARKKLSKLALIPEEAALVEQAFPSIVFDLDSLIRIGQKNRPEIRLAEERIALALATRRFEMLKPLPWFRFIDLSYHKERKRRENWYELMMGIELPLFNWNLGNIRAARLAVERKESQAEAARETIAQEIRDAYGVYQDLWLDWHNFSRYAGEMMASADRVVQEARRHLTLKTDEVYEMELLMLDTEKLLAEKRHKLIYAFIDLCLALGIEEPESLYKPEMIHGR